MDEMIKEYKELRKETLLEIMKIIDKDIQKCGDDDCKKLSILFKNYQNRCEDIGYFKGYQQGIIQGVMETKKYLKSQKTIKEVFKDVNI